MPPDARGVERRNHALRLAFAVALGLFVDIVRGALLPPLAAVIALQLLALPGPRPGARIVVGLFAVIAAASLFAYAVSAMTADNAILFAIGVGLVYLWGFALALSPETAAPGAMVLTMGIVVTTLSAASTGLALLLVGELLVSVLLGIALVFLAHAVFPTRLLAVLPAGAAGDGRGPDIPVARRALVATLIALPLHLALTADGLAALVILLTVATMLRQPDAARSARYGISFAAGNLLGGLLAALAVLVVSMQENAAVLASVLAAASLVMASQIVRTPALGHVLLPGFVAFALLFGLAFSPLTPSAEVAVATRILQIVFAALYALGAVSLARPLVRGSTLAPA